MPDTACHERPKQFGKKSGTAEDNYAFVSLHRDKGIFFAENEEKRNQGAGIAPPLASLCEGGGFAAKGGKDGGREPND